MKTEEPPRIVRTRHRLDVGESGRHMLLPGEDVRLAAKRLRSAYRQWGVRQTPQQRFRVWLFTPDHQPVHEQGARSIIVERVL